jgi:hypothetical protein
VITCADFFVGKDAGRHRANFFNMSNRHNDPLLLILSCKRYADAMGAELAATFELMRLCAKTGGLMLTKNFVSGTLDAADMFKNVKRTILP